MGCIVHGVTKSQTQLSIFHFTSLDMVEDGSEEGQERTPACEDGRGGRGFWSRQQCLGPPSFTASISLSGSRGTGVASQASHRFSKGGKLFAEAALEQTQGLCVFLVEVPQ